uniref:Uncharacterized protein n=1 Tax=Cacopsylla melanoneura TaxID=428564 RepID=A0A8D8MCU5_9HEMI
MSACVLLGLLRIYEEINIVKSIPVLTILYKYIQHLFSSTYSYFSFAVIGWCLSLLSFLFFIIITSFSCYHSSILYFILPHTYFIIITIFSCYHSSILYFILPHTYFILPGLPGID